MMWRMTESLSKSATRCTMLCVALPPKMAFVSRGYRMPSCTCSRVTTPLHQVALLTDTIDSKLEDLERDSSMMLSLRSVRHTVRLQAPGEHEDCMWWVNRRLIRLRSAALQAPPQRRSLRMQGAW